MISVTLKNAMCQLTSGFCLGISTPRVLMAKEQNHHVFLRNEVIYQGVLIKSPKLLADISCVQDDYLDVEFDPSQYSPLQNRHQKGLNMVNHRYPAQTPG